ncbi:MAG: Abi-alpha family protein [Jatrophihabitans sp.]
MSEQVAVQKHEVLPAGRPLGAERKRPRPGPGNVVERAQLASRMVTSNVTTTNLVGFRGLARLGAATALRAVTWMTKGSVDSATGLVREIGSGAPIIDIVDHRVEAARTAAWRALGLTGGAESQNATDRILSKTAGYGDLRKQGDALLARSTDPLSQPANEHPAFSRILGELAPDEARILRFMALAGPQPAIDVRTKTPFGVGSERLAGGINLIADMAGCAYPERNQQYLANLNRLGMVRFSEEQVDDPRRYSFIEAQPVASDAMAKAKKAVTIYRSIYLSLFGHQFCEVCFSLEGYDAGGWIRDIR